MIQQSSDLAQGERATPKALRFQFLSAQILSQLSNTSAMIIVSESTRVCVRSGKTGQIAHNRFRRQTNVFIFWLADRPAGSATSESRQA